MRELNKRQSDFIEHYLITNNAARACRLAGYTGNNLNVQGAKLLRDPRVKGAIEAARSVELETNNITREGILTRIYQISQQRQIKGTLDEMKCLVEICKINGWYNGEVQVSDNRSLTFIMPNNETKTIKLDGNND